MKKYYIIITIIFSLLLSSCEDFLNNTPKHDWAIENAMTSYEKAQQAVNGIYAEITTGGDLNFDNYYFPLAIRSGLIYYSSFSKNINFEYTQSTVRPYLWRTAYSGLNAANLAVNGIELVPDEAFPDIKAKNELIGEARFLRGYLHSILLMTHACWWDTDDSEFGILYRDETINVANVSKGRITVGESWQVVLDDINFGIENMSDNFETPKKVSKIFAKAYKAKLLLRRGTMRNSSEDIEEAKALIDDVINNLPSSIQMESDMEKLYENSWDSKENIFVRYLDESLDRARNAGSYLTSSIGSRLGDRIKPDYLPEVHAPTVDEAVCGLTYGLDWIRSDPRWPVHVGPVPHSSLWASEKYFYQSWKKLYRLGAAQGPVQGDEKWAVYHMRLPELYILQSELRARTGSSNADAIAPINLMRSKRTYPVLPQIETPATKEELMDIIFKEYIKELIMENGTEFWISLRFQKNGKTYMEEIKGPDFVFDKTKLQWPIPDNEMTNNELMVQNPGQN